MHGFEPITNMRTDAILLLAALKHSPSATPSKLKHILWSRYAIRYNGKEGNDLLKFYCETVKTQEVVHHEQYCGKKRPL